MKQWYRIENKADDSATVYVYDSIGEWGITADVFVRDLAALKVGTVNLRINSPGGQVFDAVAIYNALTEHSAKVNVTVDGLAASAASFVAMAGDTVTMGFGSQMMIHEAQGLALGNAEDMRSMAEILDRVSDSIAGFYAARAGGEVADWRERMRAETWYSAQEAVDAGLADAVSGKDDEPSKSSSNNHSRLLRARHRAHLKGA